jgi:hypothetical protein
MMRNEREITPMTYQDAWNIISHTSYDQAETENWLDEWELANEHVRIADYDYSVGIIPSVNAYDAK